MNLRLPLALLLTATALAITTPAQSRHRPGSTGQADTQEMGTPEQRAACRPDVRRFCRHVKPDEGPMAYVSCLSEHREKLRPTCVRVLDGGVP
jgi:hypothetical protein